MKKDEKNIIFGMGLVGSLLMLIVVFGGIYNITGTAVIEKPMRQPCTDLTGVTEINVSSIGLTICAASSPYNMDDADTDGAIIFNESNGALICETTGTTIFGSNIPGSYGVYSSNHENITIKNCTFVGYDSGIRIDNAVGGNSNVSITSTTVFNSTYGFYLKYVVNRSFTDNIIYNVTHGIYLDNVKDCYFGSNEIYNATKNAVWIDSGCFAPGNTFASNTIYNNTGNGINVSSQLQLIENNTIYNTSKGDSSLAAIKIWDINNEINNNNITGDGIQIISTNFTKVLNNEITNPEDNGIFLDSANETNITKNIITGSGCVGINLTGTNATTIYNNYVNCSGGINAFDDLTNYWNISYGCSGISNIINGSCMGGNYWGDYSGHSVTDSDGIGNTSLPYNSTSNITNGGDWFPLVCLDADGDGYSPSPYFTSYCGARDCNDGNSAVNPGANEKCANNIDDDCDGQTDCSDNDCSGAAACQEEDDTSGGSTSGVSVPYIPSKKTKKQTYTYLEPGMSFNENTNTLTVVISKSQTLESLKVKLKDGSSLPEKVSVESKVKQVKECSDVSGVSSNTILSCSNIYSTIPNEDIDGVTIRYKVPNILLAEKRVDIDSLFAVRKDEKLSVKEVRSDDSFTYFDVTSPGFSLFTVAGKSIPKIIIDMRPLQISLVVLAISAVLWIVLLGYHFKQKPLKEKPLSPHIAGLHGYVQRSKNMGFSEHEIKNALRTSGWSEKHIVEALKKFFG